MDQCICNGKIFSVHCPQAFYQGGQMLHKLEQGENNHPTFVVIVDPDSKKSEVEVQNLKPAPLRVIEQSAEAKVPTKIFNTPHIEAEELMADKREILRKFESLNLGGQYLTDVSIGGFEIDLAKTAEKAREIAPLPPFKLPRIFIDTNMNFLHHFFQGLERLIGREKLILIGNAERHYTTEDLVLLPLIENIIQVGYERRDSTLTVFTKSVLCATFECEENPPHSVDERRLSVATNIWGFQYIEPGMQLKEPDLRMWLSINYGHFRTTFFNTFKDSGMPSFAMEGVQTRYETVTPKTYHRQQIEYVSSREDSEDHYMRHQRSRRNDDNASYTSRRTSRKTPKQTSIGQLLFNHK